MKASDARRFWAKVEKTDGCWLWTARTNKGYGHFWLNGRIKRAHRVAYEEFVGPIPEGLELDHLCRVRRCVNPLHLEPVTRRENVRRGEGPAGRAARRTHCIHGHEYTPENTSWRRDGRGRRCRACERRTVRAA